jgi:DNA-binding MarR family transcriptional regulator
MALALYEKPDAVATKDLPLVTHIPHATVLRLIGTLQKEGLATLSAPDPKTKARHATLTEKGRAVVTDIIVAAC